MTERSKSGTSRRWMPHLTNPIGMKFNMIPAGTCTMGEGDDAHEVTLTQRFNFGVDEVPQAQYARVISVNQNEFKGADNPVRMTSRDTVLQNSQKRVGRWCSLRVQIWISMHESGHNNPLHRSPGPRDSEINFVLLPPGYRRGYPPWVASMRCLPRFKLRTLLISIDVHFCRANRLGIQS